MNTVWDALPEIRGFDGHIMFLEDDHFLFPNALQQLLLLIEAKNTLCSQCSFVALGPKDRHPQWGRNPELLVDARANEGMIFNRSVWNSLRGDSRVSSEFTFQQWFSQMEMLLIPMDPGALDPHKPVASSKFSSPRYFLSRTTASWMISTTTAAWMTELFAFGTPPLHCAGLGPQHFTSARVASTMD